MQSSSVSLISYFRPREAGRETAPRGPARWQAPGGGGGLRNGSWHRGFGHLPPPASLRSPPPPQAGEELRFRRHRIAGRVAADEGPRTDRGAGVPQRRRQRRRCRRSLTETSRAAPSKARSGTAIASVTSPARLSTEAALQPDTRTLHTSVSVTMASAATREMTNTGKPAGWSARSTNGSRAMIFGARRRIRAPSTMGRRRRWRRRVRGRDRLWIR